MTNSKLEKLQQRRANIDQQIKAAQSKERQRARKEDTRRKIIAGALALEHAEKNPHSEFAKKLDRLLDEYVTKPNERALFELPVNDNLRDEFSEKNNQETPSP